MVLKLPNPPPDDGTRSEFVAYMKGFATAIAGIKQAYHNFETYDIMKTAIYAATELYPPFEKTPPPVKTSGDGRELTD